MPEAEFEDPDELQSENQLLARINFLITFDHDSLDQAYEDYHSKQGFERELADAVRGIIVRDFADSVEILFNGQVKAKIERLRRGSIFGSIGLVLVSGVAVYEFVAQYKDFHESLLLLRQHIGLAIWIGGAIFGGIQIASVQEQTQSTLQEIRQVEQELVDAELQLRHFLETHTDDVQQASEEAIANIETESARAILLVTAPVTDVQRVGQEAITMIENERDRTLQDIQTQKRRVTELLNVDSLPDLSEINRQIEVLEEAGGRLDFATYAKFARTSLIDISVIVITALVLSVLAIILAIWPKRS